MPTLREYEQVLQRDPSASEPFLALRQAYRESGRFDKLVTLYEDRAQALEDGPKASELFYLAAEVRVDQLSDKEGAEADLMHAVDRDPGNLKAVDRLKLMYREPGRVDDYITLLEVEGAALAKGGDAARSAALVAEAIKLEGQYLQRLERAVSLPPAQRQAEVTPDGLKLVESFRKIHRAVSDWAGVVRLFDLELALTAEPKRRTDLLLGVGRVLGEKVGDLEGAAQRLNEVVRLRPRDDKALEALASVYANPKWLGGDGRERAAAIFHQVARRRQEAGDIDNAVATLRRALVVVPGHAESSDLLERVLYEAGRFGDLDLYYRERLAAAATVEDRMDYLFKRAQLAEGELANPAEALRSYEELVGIEPLGGPASQRLGDLYLASRDFAKLAQLRERQLEGAADPAFRLGLMADLAALYRERLGDPEQAAVYYHAILQDDPGNPEAQQAYAEHFRQRGDWKALLDLQEFSFEHARASGGSPEDLLTRLEEIAVVAERNLQDAERALAAWQRMEELSPGHDRAREAQKRILQKGKQWDRMASVLEREAKGAKDPALRIEALKRLARTHIEKMGDQDRAILIYQEILGIERDPVALRALMDIFEKTERWPDLAQLLRAQLDHVTVKQERLNALRRLLWIYDDRLDNRVDSSWAATEILQLQPGDREAVERLEAILERSDDKPRLVETLVYHTRYAPSSEEKQRLLHRIGDLLQNHMGDVAQAVPHWEELLRIQPADATALEALTVAYEQLGRAPELGDILERQIDRMADDPSTQAVYLRRLAHLAAGPLADAAGARRTWEDLLRIFPSDPEALEALAATYAAAGEWRNLVAVMERQIPLQSDPVLAVSIALERARIFEEDLKIRAEAVRALEQIVGELDPRCLPAFDSLRRLAEAGGEWARVADVAERQLHLTEDPVERIERALEIGLLWRDRLQDARRAMSAFERASEIDPQNTKALYALAALYAEAGEWARLIQTDDKLLQQAPDLGERRRLMFEIAETCAGPMREPRLGFDWFRRAYAEHPDDEALGRLEALGEAHRLWEELIQVYDGARTRATEANVKVALLGKIARIAEEFLEDPARAFAVLRDGLDSDPTGEILLPQLERLAEASAQWAGLLDVYARVGRARPAIADRIELLERRAVVREERLGDAPGALEEVLRAFGFSPDSDPLRLEILRLAGVTGRWEDALGVEAQLFARATTIEKKIEIACRAAALVEDKVRDRARAFRAYLNAFRLAPENEGITAHLWRLAALVAQGEGADAEELDADLMEDDADDDVLEVDDVGAVVQTGANDAPMPRAPGRAPAIPETAKRPSPWVELAQAFESLPAPDSATKHRYLSRMADVWERGARDIPMALGTLERAFTLNPSDVSVRDDLARIAETEGRWDDVCAIYLRVAEDLPQAESVRLQHDVAAFRDHLGQPVLAEERYRAILNLEPGDVRALDRLEEILREAGRFQDLVVVLDKRVSGAVEALPAGVDRRRKAMELAALFELKLERPYEAIDVLEKYVTSAQDDDRGPEHPDVVLENCTALDGLGRLYARVGLWTKAVDALEREIDLVGEPETLRGLRTRLAVIFEREMGKPERATEAYEAVLETAPNDPEALTALSRLLETQGRWETLADILERRTRLCSEDEKIELVKRRARLFEEELGNAEAAAGALRTLGTLTLRDDDLGAALLRNLVRAGLAHEALRFISQRKDLLEQEHAAPERLVTLRLEAAQLRAEHLNDSAGAREEVEAALALKPDHLKALGVLAQLHLRGNDFAAYTQIRRKEAIGYGRGKEAAAAFIEVGRVLRDQLGDPAGARPCFQDALQADPENVEALRSLGSLLVADGQLAEARALYEAHVDKIPVPGDRAVLLTDLGRMLWQAPGDAPAAIARLDEAIEIAPDYLPAVVTMADVYFKEQQWGEAERRLLQALRRMKAEPAEMAALYHRLAEVYEKLGRLEEGYRQLVEADRAAPGQLLLRLALGENRFVAKKWREATNHLQGIAEHKDAPRYPDEVAQGLYHAGLAELRLRRPERATPLLEAALSFSEDHGPTLQALVDLALETGEQSRAAVLLRRLAEATGERSDRARLFEQLGDIQQALGQKVEARRAYETAVGLLDTASESQLPLLQKTLDLEREAGAIREAAETAQRIIDLVQDPKDRAHRRLDAAVLLLSQGAADKAAAYLEKAVQESPYDELVLASLVTAFLACGRADELQTQLDEALPQLPDLGGSSADRARRAELWQTLGTLRSKSDRKGAIEALETAVAVDGTRAAARIALAGLYSDDLDYVEAALRNHRELVLADVTQTESVRALGNAYASQGRLDRARCCFEVLDLFGQANDEEHTFLMAHLPPARNPDDPYARALEDADRQKLLAAPAELRAMTEVFGALWEGLPALYGPSLEGLELAPQDKISPLSDLTLGKVYGQTGKALGNKRTSLYQSSDPSVIGVLLLLAPPPSVVIAAGLVDTASLAELRFHIGRALELSRPEHLLAAAMSADDFDGLLTNTLKAFHPRHAKWRAGDPGTEQAAKLKKSLPYKAAKRLSDLFSVHENVSFSSALWRQWINDTGNRAGLALSGDLALSARLVMMQDRHPGADVPSATEYQAHATQEGPLRELLRFALSDDHFALREDLGTSVSSAAAA